VLIVIEAGSSLRKAGSSFRMRSTTSTVFAPGWRCTARITPRWSTNHAAARSFSTLSTTCPSSSRRTGLPLRQATTAGRQASASMSWPVACTVSMRCGPCIAPVGRFTLSRDAASATSSSPSPREASSRGSSWMRSAYFWAPKTCTCATPLSIEMRWLMRVSAYSLSVLSGSVGEVTAR
jgi:hypothetical protein